MKKLIKMGESEPNNNIIKINDDENFSNSSIVICEECFNIPKITILKKNKVKIECLKCNTKDIKDISYFDKFLNGLNEKKFIDLPKCTFDEKHESKADKYCFQCTKYLCKECIINHNKYFKERSHILIGQKIENQYYCNQKGHKEYIYNGYCTECNKYLCPQCKCEHKTENIYYFDDSRNKDVINEIIKKVNECEKIIEDEEKKYNNFLEELNNKIKTIKSMFNEYKERNMKIITLYKLLIKNYEQIKNIRNYNINNNIIINNDFDLSNSDDFIIKNNHDTDECFSSKFNKLCNFYANKNHIRTKQYTDYSIIKKFCNKIVKKAIFVDEKKFIFIFDNDQYVYYLYNNNENGIIRTQLSEGSIRDIQPLKHNKFISIDNYNVLKIWEINNETINLIKNFNNVNFAVVDLFDNDNFFLIRHDNLKLNIEYYNYNNKRIHSLFFLNDNHFSIESLFEEINEMINDSIIEDKDKEELKKIFTPTKKDGIKSRLLTRINNDLLKIIDDKYKRLYNALQNKLNTNEQKSSFINSNYIHMILYKELSKKECKLEEQDIEKIKALFDFNNLYTNIRKKYIHYLILSSKINNIYNYSNTSLLFMGDNYLFIEFRLKNKEFDQCIFYNTISDDKCDYNNFEIIKIYSNFIILNNFNTKIIYIIEYDYLYLIKNKYNYYENTIFNDKYLLFDNVKNYKIQLTLLDISNNSNLENHEIKELLNIDVNNYNPRLFLFNSNYKLVTLYDKNQICILEFHLTENETNDGDDNKLREINKIKMLDPRTPKLVVGESLKIISSSDCFNRKYNCSMMFEDKSYFCSLDKKNFYFVLDFLEEYYFLSFKIIFHEEYKNCIPKIYTIQVYDDKNKEINEILYETKNDILEENKKIDEKARYIRFNFIENFGGNYFIIKNIYFNFRFIDDII